MQGLAQGCDKKEILNVAGIVCPKKIINSGCPIMNISSLKEDLNKSLNEGCS